MSFSKQSAYKTSQANTSHYRVAVLTQSVHDVYVLMQYMQGTIDFVWSIIKIKSVDRLLLLVLSLVHVLGQVIQSCCLWLSSLLLQLFNAIIHGLDVLVNGLNVIVGSMQGIHYLLSLIDTDWCTEPFLCLWRGVRNECWWDQGIYCISSHSQSNIFIILYLLLQQLSCAPMKCWSFPSTWRHRFVESWCFLMGVV